MRPLLPLLAGLALGAGATLALRHTRTPDAAPTSSAKSGSGTSSAPEIIHHKSYIINNPRLDADSATAALDAWLALGDPAATPPAPFASQVVALRALLTVLPDELFPRLLDALVLRGGDDARRLRQIAFDIWNERASPDAARWAAATTPGKTFDARARSRLARQAATTWARADFEPAYAWAAALSDGELSRDLVKALLSQLAATDPTRALALARARGEEFFKTAQMDLFLAWAALDPAAAVQSMGAPLLTENRHEWRVQQALRTWIERDAPAAVAWLNAQPTDPSRPWDSLSRNVISQVAHSGNPAALPALAAALTAAPDDANRFSNLSTLLTAWTQKDADAALKWVKTLPDAAQRADLIEQVVPSDYPELKNPDSYLPLALALPPGPERDKKIADLLANWTRSEPEAALAWIRAHDDPSLASAATIANSALIGDLAATDPAAALAAWRGLPSDANRASAFPAIAKAWAKTDPAGATRWIFEQMPATPSFNAADFQKLSPEAQRERMEASNAYYERQRHLANASSAWFGKDPLGAVAWIESLPDPKQRETALSSLNMGTTYYEPDSPDPTERAALLSQVKDSAMRDQVLSEHLKKWMRSDLHAARAWIDSNDALSPEQAARLLTETGLAP